ncbi:hypothetical protein [Hymenobacter properus]|uniref:Uncharacterized protein n=1 Tax=Hymenobacter properus TaxID=2791026 RepID=A0A931BHQ9_9BACT|nr:hypothetical protein [Hymenobacter properus]MBF9144174.1 hypothetical protein [Hymenobacter properus]MBR7722990.1 hypothetical protein [Microvirga sp. SRT04]
MPIFTKADAVLAALTAALQPANGAAKPIKHQRIEARDGRPPGYLLGPVSSLRHPTG